MAVEVTLVGSGTIGQIQPGWSVSEDATPVAPGDTSGGTGDISFSARQGEDSEFVIDNLLTFEHDVLGTITGGRITSATSNGATELTDTDIPLSGTKGLELLNSTRVAPPVWEGSDLTIPPFGVTGAISGRITRIYDIAVDATGGFIYLIGSLYVDAPSYYFPQVLQFRLDGSLVGDFASSAIAGTFTNANLTAGGIDPVTGDLLIGAEGFGNILRFSRSGSLLATYGAFGTGDGQFQAVDGIAVDASQNIYVADATTGRVTKLNSSGVYQAKVASTGAAGVSVSGSIVWVSRNGTTPTFNGWLERYNTSLTLQDSQAYTGGPRILHRVRAVSATTAWRNTTDNELQLVDNAGTVLQTVSTTPVPSPPRDSTPPWVLVPVVLPEMFNLYGSEILAASANGSVTLSSPTPRVVPLGTTAPNTLQGAVRTYLDLFDPGMTLTWNASIDPDVEIPGWNTTGWDVLKQIATAYGIEFTWVNDGIVCRDLGTVELSLDNVEAGSVSLSLNSQGSGRSVDFKNYNTTSGFNITLWDAFVAGNTLQVNANETTTVTIQTDSYPTTVAQPIVSDATALPAGQYRVSGSDNLPVVAAQWTAFGGSVTVAINPDTPGALDITIKGPSPIPGVTGPYSLAVSDGATSYPQFSVIGSGVVTDPETVNILSGADHAKVTQEVAFSVDNICHANRTLIYDRCTWALTIASGPTLSLDATVPTRDIAGFGLTAGSLVSFKESQYRVVTADIGNEWTQITASRHITVGEFDAFMAAAGVQVGEFDTFWDGNECEDLKIKTLRPVV